MNVAASASNCMQRRVRCLVIKSKKSAREKESGGEGKSGGQIQYSICFQFSIDYLRICFKGNRKCREANKNKTKLCQ